MNLTKALRLAKQPTSFLTISLTLFSFFIVYINKENLPPEIPLWYSKIWGEQRLVSQEWLWIIPILIVIIFVINQFISNFLSSDALVKLISWSSVVFGLLITYSLVRILLLVL